MARRCCQSQTSGAAESCSVQAHAWEMKNKGGAGERGQEDAVSRSAGAVPPLWAELISQGSCGTRVLGLGWLWNALARYSHLGL